MDRKSFKGELAKLATTKWLGRVTRGIEIAIAKSFRTDTVLRPVQTRAEVERRFNMCAEIFFVLRKDLGWSIPRIVDEMPSALRKKLDGAPWAPDSTDTPRKAWAGDAPACEGVIDLR